MGIEQVSKIVTKGLTQAAKKAYVKPMCEVRTLESLGIKMEQLTGDTLQVVQKKNPIKMDQVSDIKFLFYDGETVIGRAKMGPFLSDTAVLGELPKTWYIPGGVIDETNKLPTFPILHVDEIIINDKKGLFAQYQKRLSGKKYGTMCMQKILEYAEQNGYGNRISLDAEKWGSNIHPGKFYAKIGFEPGPKTIQYLQKENERYYKGIKFLAENPDLPEEIKIYYSHMDFYEQIDGRFISKEGIASRLYLTHPEVLRNYPL